MDAVSDPYLREIWVMKSAQIGWTEILGNVVGFHVDQDPAPILLVQPTLEMAEAWSKDRFAPMLRDSPCFTGKIADARSRDSGNTLLHKQFPGGHITMAGANSPAGLASRPIRVVLFDEVDRFPQSAATEGDPISLGRKRSTTFWNRIMLAGSTPTVKGRSRIEAGFNSSDQRYYYVPCPHCDEFQRLVWAQVKWTDDPKTAAYACQHCGSLITDADKGDMLAKGEWRATKPTNGIAGFHISELYSPWVTWVEMVEAFLEAKALPETLQTWINTSLGETWEEAGTTIEAGSLLERRGSYGEDPLPAGVLMLTAGCDTQDDRVEVQLNGWGVDEENWIVAQKVFRGDPDSAALWQDVDAYLLQIFQTEDGRQLRIEAVAIDSGGHYTQSVYKFVVSRKRRRVWAIKGVGGPGRLAWPKQASRTPKSRASVFILGVDAIKSVLYGRLQKVNEPGPGYIHLFAEANEEFCKQLTSEKAITRYQKGRPILVWEPRSKSIQQEAQDCWNYAYAAFLGRSGPELLKRLARRVGTQTGKAIIAMQPQVETEELQKPAQSVQTMAPERRPMRHNVFMPKRRGWVKGW